MTGALAGGSERGGGCVGAMYEAGHGACATSTCMEQSRWTWGEGVAAEQVTYGGSVKRMYTNPNDWPLVHVKHNTVHKLEYNPRSRTPAGTRMLMDGWRRDEYGVCVGVGRRKVVGSPPSALNHFSADQRRISR